ncbi:MAG TPA: hypothetical protein VEI47_02960, partial [Gemmatimonadales bacterium]|nr:hypothetical protein [Gemmatimonadales bacterium]
MRHFLLALPLAVLGATACAVGPSVTLGPPPAPVTARDSSISPSSRSFFDSLTTVRDAERPDSMVPAVAAPVPLVLDSAGDIGWLAVLRDTTLIGLVR